MTVGRAMRETQGIDAADVMRRRRSRRFGLLRASGVALVLLALSGASVGARRAVAETPAPVADPPAEAPAGRLGFVGHNLFGDADGEFHVWRVVERAVDLADPTPSRVVVEVSLASVDTGSEKRDEHLRTADFFDVEKFPVATVSGHSPRPLPPSKEGHARYSIQLDVDLHGVKKTIPGEVEVVATDPVVVEGAFTLLRTAFGIGEAPSRWNPASIDDEVPVRFRIEFR
jgi:polyisoprenoid-binding protein YceI